MKLSLTKWAKADIIRAGGWYEQKGDRLGGEFVYQVDAALSRIARNPAGYAKVVRENRRCTLSNFLIRYGFGLRVKLKSWLWLVFTESGHRRLLKNAQKA